MGLGVGSTWFTVAVAYPSPWGRAGQMERPCCHTEEFGLYPVGRGSHWRVLTGMAGATVTQVVVEVMATEPPTHPGHLPENSSVEHLALILIETVGFGLFSGLAYFPSSVSALVVSDLMKLNRLHLTLRAQERLQIACSSLSPFGTF